MKFDFYRQLLDSKEFLAWQKAHPQDYLAHFYCPLNPSFQPASNWEIGFYNPQQDKLTVFVIKENSRIEIKPPEDAFKAQGSIEELASTRVKLSFPQALELFQKTKQENYPQEILLNGFLILQNFQNKTIWNISYATRSFNILNVKIDALNKEIVSHQLVNFIERKAG